MFWGVFAWKTKGVEDHLKNQTSSVRGILFVFDLCDFVIVLLSQRQDDPRSHTNEHELITTDETSYPMPLIASSTFLTHCQILNLVRPSFVRKDRISTTVK